MAWRTNTQTPQNPDASLDDSSGAATARTFPDIESHTDCLRELHPCDAGPTGRRNDAECSPFPAQLGA